MIFVTLGSQKFQFNRLLQVIDTLIENKTINEEVFAQVGASDYTPKYFKYKAFMDTDEFNSIMRESKIVITHGGTGTIIKAVKQGKKVLAVPRIAKYGEHVDDHQEQIVKQFIDANIIYGVMDLDELREALLTINKKKVNSYTSNTQTFMESIDDFIKMSFH